MNQLSIDRRYGLMFRGMVYATGTEDVHTRIANKQAILDQQAREAQETEDWLTTYSAFCD